jgi:hypothetical protein
MKRIFKLTKPEQRVVILIVAALVAITFARHWFETKLQPPPTLTSSPALSPTPLPKREDTDD